MVVTQTYRILEQLKPVDMSPTTGTFTHQVYVILTCQTPGAGIRFTTDGREPNAASLVYPEGSVHLQDDGIKAVYFVVKAYASKVNMSNSATAVSSSETPIMVMPQVKAPVIQPTSLDLHTDLVQVTIYCNTDGSTIYWTDDGFTPTMHSRVFLGTMVLHQTGVEINAFAVATGLADSAVTRGGPCVIQPPEPVFEPDGGEFKEHVSVRMGDASHSALIHYTVSDDPHQEPPDPTTQSPTYTGQLEFVRAYTKIKAFASQKTLENTSIVTSHEYWVRPIAPTFSKSGGTFVGQASVTISSSTPETIIRCTLDGTTPNLNTPAHPNPAELNIMTSGTVIKCVSTAHQQAISHVTTSGEFRIKSNPPIVRPNGGVIDLMLTLLCEPKLERAASSSTTTWIRCIRKSLTRLCITEASSLT